MLKKICIAAWLPFPFLLFFLVHLVFCIKQPKCKYWLQHPDFVTAPTCRLISEQEYPAPMVTVKLVERDAAYCLVGVVVQRS